MLYKAYNEGHVKTTQNTLEERWSNLGTTLIPYKYTTNVAKAAAMPW